MQVGKAQVEEARARAPLPSARPGSDGRVMEAVLEPSGGPGASPAEQEPAEQERVEQERVEQERVEQERVEPGSLHPHPSPLS